MICLHIALCEPNTSCVAAVKAGAVEVMREVAAPGNRSDVRALALSDNDSLLLSTGNGGAKLWNALTGAHLNDVATGYGLTALFAPGGRYALVGCKDGHIDIIDIGMAAVVEHVAAHSGQVRTATLLARCRCCQASAADNRNAFDMHFRQDAASCIEWKLADLEP